MVKSKETICCYDTTKVIGQVEIEKYSRKWQREIKTLKVINRERERERKADKWLKERDW